MTPKENSSFKATLRRIAKENNRDPADLWQCLTLERFLVRLAKSKYSDRFVLKGGILLSKYIEIGRETVDLDFLAQKISNDRNVLEKIVNEIADIDIGDGFSFEGVKLRELAHPHMGYPGIEVAMIGHFGKTKFKVAIDLGFGDIVESVNYSIPLTRSSKGELFEKNISLSCYPLEFIFAEKLETIVYRGSINSRMKDFHDLFSMITSPTIHSFQNLDEIVKSVFEHRGTKLTLPIIFTREEEQQLQSFWRNYLNTLQLSNVVAPPKTITDLLSKMNNWLKSHTSLTQ